MTTTEGRPTTVPGTTDERPAARRRGLLRRRPELLVTPAIAVVVVGAWFAAIEIFSIPDIILPSPVDVVAQLWQLLTGPEFWRNLAVTMTEFIAGFGIGSVSAVAVAAVLVRIPVLEKGVSPYIIAFQNFPKIAIAPMLVTWFGFGIAPKIALAAVLAFFPVFVNVIVGLKSSTREQQDLMRILAASEWQTFTKLRFKVALPFAFAGLRVAAVFSLLGAITGEFISASQGLGYMLLQRNSELNVSAVFALLVVMGCIGLLVHGVLGLLHRKVIFWEDSGRTQRRADDLGS